MLLGIFCSDKDEIYCYTVIVTIIIIEMSMIYLVTYVRCHCIIVLYYFRMILKKNTPLGYPTQPYPLAKQLYPTCPQEYLCDCGT